MKKRVFLRNLFCGLFLFCGSVAFANTGDAASEQESRQAGHPVSGVIVDTDGIPLVGVAVSEVENSGNVTITGVQGQFNMTVGTPNSTLRLSYFGHETMDIPLAGRSSLSVTMEPQDNMIDDIVVVGYGVQRRGSITGSVSNIGNDDIVKAPVSNLSNSLGGKLPGLRVMTRTGEPGSNDSEIDVRGFGPALVIIDGIPGEMNQIDPNEIESISVLKDAAAAVYGVMAANGVILVTTKRGRAIDTSVNMSATFSWQRPTVYPHMANAAEYAELQIENAINRGTAAPYTPQELADYRSGAIKSYDWYDAVIRPWSPQSQYSVNIRGGSEELNYFTSVGYVSEQGMWRSGDLSNERFNFRSNMDAKLGSGFSMQVSVSGRKEQRDSPQESILNVMAGIQKNYPVYAPYANDNEEYYGGRNAFNPLAYTDSDVVGYRNRTRKVFDGSMALNYDASAWAKGLSAKAMYYYRFSDTTTKDFTKKYSLYNYDEATDTYNPTGGRPTSTLEEENTRNDYNNFQGSVNYLNTFNEKHAVGAMLVFETRIEKEAYFSGYREYIIDVIDELDSGSQANKSSGGSSRQLGNIGYIGRFNYAYDNKYLIEFQFRYDGSSKFPEDGRWGLFPSISAGWRISQENFIKNNSAASRIIEDIKLRASWGRLGDDRTNPDSKWNDFNYVTGYTYPSGSYLLGSGTTSGLIDKGLPNAMLTWFTSDLYNVGLDFSLWRGGMLSGEFDLFYRKREGLMATRTTSLPGTFGAILPQENLNSDSHRGFEFALSHRNELANGFEYMVRGNVSYTRSKNNYIERAPLPNQWENWRNNSNDRWKNRLWGYTAIGQFQSYEEIASSPVQDATANNTLRPGDIKYRDFNGDGVIDTNDQSLIGRNDEPEYIFGLDLSAAWKGFDVSVFLQGAANFNVMYINEYTSPFFNGENSVDIFMDRWHRADLFDPNSEWIPGKYPSTYSNGSPNNTRVSTFWMQNCSYLRIKELQLGYSIPERLTAKAGISNLRVFVTAYNMFTFTGADLLDPESVSGDGRYYPQQKSVSFGLNMSF
jgi:TonB-linked SusC/RagA family outer membrane protein